MGDNVFRVPAARGIMVLGELTIHHDYDVLGVRSNATPEAIQEAYRERVRYCLMETDLVTDALLLRTAYVLSDPPRRTEYDTSRKSSLGNGQPELEARFRILAKEVTTPWGM